MSLPETNKFDLLCQACDAVIQASGECIDLNALKSLARSCTARTVGDAQSHVMMRYHRDLSWTAVDVIIALGQSVFDDARRKHEPRSPVPRFVYDRLNLENDFIEASLIM